MMPLVAFVDGSIARSRDVGGICIVSWRFDEKNWSAAHRITWIGLDGILHDKKNIKITNNTMELNAVYAACKILLAAARPQQRILVWTDSQYARGCLSKDYNWAPTKNREMIQAYRKITARPEVEIYWVRGHAGIVWNELANLGAQKVIEIGKGFSGSRDVTIHLTCAGCRNFACKDSAFGKKTSILNNAYSDPCDKYVRWERNLLESASIERVGGATARALQCGARDDRDDKSG